MCDRMGEEKKGQVLTELFLEQRLASTMLNTVIKKMVPVQYTYMLKHALALLRNPNIPSK